jgi:hypothetical protein
MDAAHAICDLTEISPQVRDVVVMRPDGAAAGSNLTDDAAVARLAEGAKRLVEAAEALRPGVAQLEAATLAGSVFVVRDGDRLIAATTTPEPTVGLVFYDLKTCLRAIDTESAPVAPKPVRRRAAAKPKADDATA